MKKSLNRHIDIRIIIKIVAHARGSRKLTVVHTLCVCIIKYPYCYRKIIAFHKVRVWDTVMMTNKHNLAK